MDADEDLNALVFGESIFNDAIAVVMYNTFRILGKHKGESEEAHEAGAQSLEAAGSFFTIFIGSIAIGVTTAMMAAFIQKRQSHHSEGSLEDEVNLSDKELIRKIR